MKTETFEGSVEAYQGKTLDSPLEFSGSAQIYENVAEAKASEDWPGDSETLKIVNTKLITAAKAKEYQRVTADLKKAYEASPDFKRNNLIKAAVAAGFSQAEAEALAASKLGS
jgi:hypothetical protein